MRISSIWILITSWCLLWGILLCLPYPALALPGFDIKQMSDMSDFDPNHPVVPTGDTIKIAVMEIFTGAGAGYGEFFWLIANWVAHDINKRGGIFVDGKQKKIQLVKGDTQGKPAIAKAVAEKLCLDEKVDVLWGITGSHLALAIQQVAGRHKVIFIIHTALSDQLMDGRNFNRYTFRACWTTTMAAQGLAYLFSQRPERRFYLFCQDYLFGHDLAQAFKQGLRKCKPNAEIVGEDYHPLWTKDFAPYLTKIKGSRAEIIVTGDWDPDAGTLLKQARELGIKLHFAHLFMDDPNVLLPVGPAGSTGLLNINRFLMDDGNIEHRAWLRRWNDQWKRWKKPYNTPLYKWPLGGNGEAQLSLYWVLDVIRRAGSTDPEKIIQTWEGDEWHSMVGPVKMRACDHQMIMDLWGTEYVYPNKWFEGCAFQGKIIRIPARYVSPPVPEELERCGR